MGVSGCGKTVVGQRLSQLLNLPFFDGDDYHPPANIAKMSAGVPLNDADRIPWLAILRDIISDHLRDGQSLILASSALKQTYRDQIAAPPTWGDNPRTVFIHLQGGFDLIYQRMKSRKDHYMKADMLRSQFAALEEPADALIIDIDQSVEEIVNDIIDRLELIKK